MSVKQENVPEWLNAGGAGQKRVFNSGNTLGSIRRAQGPKSAAARSGGQTDFAREYFSRSSAAEQAQHDLSKYLGIGHGQSVGFISGGFLGLNWAKAMNEANFFETHEYKGEPLFG